MACGARATPATAIPVLHTACRVAAPCLANPNSMTNMFPRQAKQLQASLMEIVDRVEVVKSEHEKLEGGNKFLQSYVSSSQFCDCS
jgi:hypothetical protein